MKKSSVSVQEEYAFIIGIDWADQKHDLESIRFSIWAKAYYEQQRAKGKKHHTAVRSLAFKWIRIIYLRQAPC